MAIYAPSGFHIAMLYYSGKKNTEKVTICFKNILLFAKLSALFGFLEGRHRKIQTAPKGLFIILMLIRSSLPAFLQATCHMSLH